MMLHAALAANENKSTGVASSPCADLSEIVALRRDRWFDVPETVGQSREIAGEIVCQGSFDDDAGLAWKRFARQRLGIGTTLFDVANGLAYAVDAGTDVILYRAAAARAPQRTLSMAALILTGEVAAARFVANGILEWVQITTATDMKPVRNEALRLGATPLRRSFALLPLRHKGGLRMISTGNEEPLILDLTPPKIGQHSDPRARRFAWAEQDAPMSYGFGAPAAEQMPIGLATLFSEPWQ